MYRVSVQNGYIVSIESMNHLTEEQINGRINTYNELFITDIEIQGKKLPLIPIYDEYNKLIGAEALPNIEYTIDKSQISTTETATITITNPSVVTAIIDGENYEVTDGIIEYSNENLGTHQITLKAEGYYDSIIEIEVI